MALERLLGRLLVVAGLGGGIFGMHDEHPGRASSTAVPVGTAVTAISTSPSSEGVP
jgi:hypothetical protein